MKRLKNALPYVIVLLLFATGCSKFMDYNENTFYSEDLIFSEFNRTQYFLSTIYSYLPNGLNVLGGAMRASGTDDAVEENDFSPVQVMVDGRWSPTQLPDNTWGQWYKGIRAANLFLQETDGQKFTDIQYNDNYSQLMVQFQYYPYEARFLRAFFYFELAKRYGDVPLVTDVLDAASANAVTRAPYDSVVDFIVRECDSIAGHLPVSYSGISGSQTGRATRGAVLALKARTLLYAASPLHNPDQDLSMWIAAAKAAKEVMDMGLYSLDGSYQNAVNNLNSSELILGRRNEESNSFEGRNFPIGYEGGNTGTCPTQNLVDAYGMQASGKPIDDPASGYDPNNPYEGRDPRFYATILYNGATWKNTSVEIWHGGKNGPPQAKATKTGYYLKKYVIESISFDPSHTTTQLHLWVLFRYGEILLDYAEAMNEAFGPTTPGPDNLSMTAAEAVNLIRKRAGMPDFPNDMTQETFRKRLRRERRVELAFEGNRFWDIRRWKIGDSTQEVYGVAVKKQGGQMQYTRTLVQKRTWEEKMNLYPIPQNEIFINKNLTQNPDW